MCGGCAELRVRTHLCVVGRVRNLPFLPDRLKPTGMQRWGLPCMSA